MALKGLEGKVAIVTGAGQGLGAAITQRLLMEGAKVMAVDINRQPLDQFVRSLGTDSVRSLVADVSTEQGADDYIRAALEHFGAVNLFVNNAGVLGPYLRIDETSLSEFEQHYAVNVRGVFLGLRAAIRQMLKQESGGAIVNISSDRAFKANARRALYGSAKRAVVGLSASAAIETARQGIRVNCVAPGGIDTPMAKIVDTRRIEQGPSYALETRPMPRKADPAEIASLVVWLLSDEASFTTGAVYVADGGGLT